MHLDRLEPTWYLCTQLPPSLSLNKSRPKKKRGEDADDGLSDIREETQGIGPARKKQKIVLEHCISQDSDNDDQTVRFLSDRNQTYSCRSRSKSENSETDSDSD